MRYLKKVPGYIVALIVGTVLVVIFKLPVETIGSRFNGIPSGLPHLAIPQLHLELMRPLIAPAITVAMLGAIESLMSAVVSDRMSGTKHNPNVELVAQGIANCASPLFGGLPATGAIARTATNIRSGATTPVAGMIHSLTLLLVILFAAPYARFIPLSVLAAILFVVSYNMGEWREVPALLRLSRLEIATWLVTFLLTVFADLTVAVEAGMILAALVYIQKVTQTTTVTRVTAQYLKDGYVHILQHKEIPPYVAIFRIHGPFLFGATDKIDEIISQIPELPHIVVVRLRNMTALDATGLQALENLAVQVRASGRAIVFCGARQQPQQMIKDANFDEHVGAENICENVTVGLQRARTIWAERSLRESGAGDSFGRAADALPIAH
jgi:sulfate permease, SulP family